MLPVHQLGEGSVKEYTMMTSMLQLKLTPTLLPFLLAAPFCVSLACSSTPATTSTPDGGSVPLPTCAAAPTNLIMHTGETAVGVTEVWKAAEGVHVVNSTRTVKGTLVIEPCAQVRLGARIEIDVDKNATLRIGAPGGGLVTVDALDPAKPWGALTTVFASSRFELTNVQVRNGGAPDPNWDAAIYVRGNGNNNEAPSKQLLVDNVQVIDSATHGIELDGNAGFDPASTGLVVTGAKESPLLLGAKSVGTVPPGTYTGNTDDWFMLLDQYKTIDVDTTWTDHGVPVVVKAGDLVIRSLTISPLLTLEAGVTIQMNGVTESAKTRFIVGESRTPPVPAGALVALGTKDKPVTFRGRGAKNDWAGINFTWTMDPRSHLDHVVIEDTGGFDATIGSECVEGLTAPDPADVGSGALRFYLDGNRKMTLRTDFLQNSTIRRSGSNGVLPDFFPTNDINFCTSNTFEDIDLCNQTPFRDSTFNCPMTPVPCLCGE
jgi:hypothetical protein